MYVVWEKTGGLFVWDVHIARVHVRIFAVEAPQQFCGSYKKFFQSNKI